MRPNRKRRNPNYPALIAFLFIVQTIIQVPLVSGQEVVAKPLMTVNMTEETGDILHGAAGFLYGISSEDVPTMNTLTPLKPKILATKGPLGTEHPYGDALDVAKTFLESGGEQVQMYNSNYYAIFGPDPSAEQYAEVLETVIAPTVRAWKEAWKAEHANDHLSDIDIDKAMVYLPINEGTPGWLGANQQNYNIFEAWKLYYQAIKRGDPNATIGGLNDWGFDVSKYKEFLEFSKAHSVIPDIFTWHELDTADLRDMSSHIQAYRQWEDEVGIEDRQVVINEYATPSDPGVPGILVNWIARLEDAKIYGALPFWHQANNLNDLAADANEGNGAWWLYKWYGDMSGQTLQVQTRNTDYDELYGLASIDNNKNNATVLFGGVDGESTIVLRNIDQTAAFSGDPKVNIKVSETQYTSFHGASMEPPVVLEGTYPVIDGNVIIEIDGMVSSSAYNITVTKANEGDRVQNPFIGKFKAWYEAEDAQTLGQAVVNRTGSFYYFSGDGRVDNIINDGDGLKYTIQVPTNGKYKLEFIYGNGVGTNRGSEEDHAPVNLTQSLSVDGQTPVEMEMRNTLLNEMFGLHTEYVDLTAGEHTLALMKSGTRGGIVHDALSVSYAGAYGEPIPAFNAVYEAELADFNTLGSTTSTQVRTENILSGYSESGYVTGLNQSPVINGGGVRWNVIVEESGLYNVWLRYQSTNAGTANLYVGNTARRFDNLVKKVELTNTDHQWSVTNATIYLQKGINIVDVDANTNIALDYLRVVEVQDQDAIRNWTRVVEAEDSIPEGSSIETRTTSEPAGITYVVGMEGDVGAATDRNKYLEVKVHVPTGGLYIMQVFHSNDDIFGTHWYNTKVIDKYVSFQVNGSEPKRYFFINTFSEDTFKEKSIPIELAAGDNTIKVYNDDSWKVLKGIDEHAYEGDPDWYQDKPGDIPLDNFAPNFDKFIFTPVALNHPIEQTAAHNVNVKFTSGGRAVADKNSVANGGSVIFNIKPVIGIEDVRLNGESRLEELEAHEDGTYRLTVDQALHDLEAEVQFVNVWDASQENITGAIHNNSFGSGDTEYWQVEGHSGGVENNVFNRYHGDHYLRISDDQDWNATISQQLEGLDNGLYQLSVHSKNANDSVDAQILGENNDFYLFANNGRTLLKRDIQTTEQYNETSIRVEVVDGSLDIGVHVNANAGFEVYLDYFELKPSSIGENIAYFVDAGDLNPVTLNAGDNFGRYNSVTDQIYGVDESTGKSWGVVDQYAADPDYPGLLTGEWTWPAENIGANDASPKEFTYRYARGQDTQWPENVEERPGVQYKFELPNGNYEVEVGLLNQWYNGWNADVYFNRGKDTEKKVLSSTPIPTGSAPLVIRDTATVTDGELTVHARMADQGSATVMISYIVVKFAEPDVNKSILQATIADANHLLEHVEAGNEPRQYPQSAIDAFLEAIAIAQSVFDQADASQADVDAAVAALGEARAAFEVSVNPESPTLDIVILEMLESGDSSQVAECVKLVITLVEENERASEEVVAIFQAVLETERNDKKSEQAVERILKQVDNILKRVLMDNHNSHADQTVREQSEKQLQGLIEKEMLPLFRD